MFVSHLAQCWVRKFSILFYRHLHKIKTLKEWNTTLIPYRQTRVDLKYYKMWAVIFVGRPGFHAKWGSTKVAGIGWRHGSPRPRKWGPLISSQPFRTYLLYLDRRHDKGVSRKESGKRLIASGRSPQHCL